MNKNLAKLISVSVSLSVWAFLPNIVNSLVRVNADTVFYISMGITSIITMLIGGYIVSKQKKPNIEIIFISGFLSFIGLGIVTYCILTGDEDEKKV